MCIKWTNWFHEANELFLDLITSSTNDWCSLQFVYEQLKAVWVCNTVKPRSIVPRCIGNLDPLFNYHSPWIMWLFIILCIYRFPLIHHFSRNPERNYETWFHCSSSNVSITAQEHDATGQFCKLHQKKKTLTWKVQEPLMFINVFKENGIGRIFECTFLYQQVCEFTGLFQWDSSATLQFFLKPILSQIRWVHFPFEAVVLAE